MTYILCILSLIGYYFIYKNYKTSYIIFIIQNSISFYITHQEYMLINILFCIGYYYKLKKQNDIKSHRNN